ncbi:family S53 protease [Exidia glandulosa HHB12029]|uniref:tripeptidyl-peptidase II n=1 Tax=Exidia glandulosa HHB12029 TaxID=1314781 RepID=A0A165EK34_EXIGL|nr:family S53 protease [Exidia glandulosa HHB12029]
MSVHERKALPRGFTRVAAAPPEKLLKMRLALKQADQKGLIDALYGVSDPKSVSYGQHLTTAEINTFMAPTPDTFASVTEWLRENGITDFKSASPAGDWLEFTVPVSKANAVFAANFTVFSHVATSSTSIRTLQYSIPTALQGKIEVLFPGVSFITPKGVPKFQAVNTQESRELEAETLNLDKRQTTIPASCRRTITPSCLQALYGVPTTPATVPSNQLAVSGFIEQFANQADLTSFLRTNRPDIANATFATQLLDGGSNPQVRSEAGVEANLDIQYTVGVATGVPTVFISVGEDQDDEVFGFLDIINFLIAEDGQPQILTTSYGSDEPDLSDAASQQLCAAYAAVGAKGTSILFASGDGGVAGSRNNPCTTFVPTFPSGCPFITTLGATTNIPETSASFSSGGFSNVFAQPDYQASAVAAYFAQIGTLNQGLFNTTGRGFPDVAAMGNNVLITVGGGTGTVGGTSCSSPIFAGIIALINDRRAAIGQPPLGFLNPFLYANPQAFSDITTGSNPGCNTNGFPALAGWDPVTGLGTPIFDALAAAAGV